MPHGTANMNSCCGCVDLRTTQPISGDLTDRFSAALIIYTGMIDLHHTLKDLSFGLPPYDLII